MPSLADIPEQYLSADRKLDFLNWLISIPTGIHESKTLMKLWASSTGATFNAEEWNFLERHRRREGERP